MRQALKGIRRSRFRAIFAGVSPRGHIILQDIRSVRGQSEHLWVPFGQWRGRLLLPDTEIAFSASVREYERGRDCSWDLGLTDIQELEVLP